MVSFLSLISVVINTNAEERYNILDDGTLMIESAQDSDKGVYECMARNAAGMTKTDKVELRYMGDTGKFHC